MHLEPGEANCKTVRDEYSPLLKFVNSAVKTDILSLFHRNPFLCDSARGIAHRIGDDRFKLVSQSLARLVKGGLLQSRIGGVEMGKVYFYSPAPPVKEKVERFLAILEDPACSGDFTEFFRRAEIRGKRLRLAVYLAGAIFLIAVIMAVGYALFRYRENEMAKRELSEGVIVSGPGAYETFYSSGRIKDRTEYFQGVKNGKYVAWFEDGQKMMEGEYQRGRRHGKWEYWDKSGRKISEVRYEEGRVVGSNEFRES